MRDVSKCVPFSFSGASVSRHKDCFPGTARALASYARPERMGCSMRHILFVMLTCSLALVASARSRYTGLFDGANRVSENQRRAHLEQQRVNLEQQRINEERRANRADNKLREREIALKEQERRDRLAAEKRKQTQQAAAERKRRVKWEADVESGTATGYWLVKVSQRRHNRTCRFWKKSKGELVADKLGKACQECGG